MEQIAILDRNEWLTIIIKNKVSHSLPSKELLAILPIKE